MTVVGAITREWGSGAATPDVKVQGATKWAAKLIFLSTKISVNKF
jgi:hypothetical protein